MRKAWRPSAREGLSWTGTQVGLRAASSLAFPFHPCSRSLQGWGLIELLLRASNEGSPRPRVARAKKIIRLHPPTLDGAGFG